MVVAHKINSISNRKVAVNNTHNNEKIIHFDIITFSSFKNLQD